VIARRISADREQRLKELQLKLFPEGPTIAAARRIASQFKAAHSIDHGSVNVYYLYLMHERTKVDPSDETAVPVKELKSHAGDFFGAFNSVASGLSLPRTASLRRP